MNIDRTVYVGDGSLRDVPKLDLLITVCGYEFRSSYILRKSISATENIAILLTKTPGGSLAANVDLYKSKSWGLVAPLDALDVLVKRLNHHSSGHIGIDISSMPRSILAELLQTIYQKSSDSMAFYFFYAPGEFKTTLAAAQRRDQLNAAPVSSFFKGAIRSPSIPIGLVLGLGLEPHRSLGVMELLEPARTWLFAPLHKDERFADAATKGKNELLAAAQAPLHQYNLDSFLETYSSLESLNFSAGVDFRLVLAPSGPKLFSLACLLVGLRRDVERPAIWRIGSAGPPRVADVLEEGPVVVAVVSIASNANTLGG